MSPKEQARTEIDRLVSAAGWIVVDRTQANIHAGRGVGIREFPLTPTPSPAERGGRGEGGIADNLLYVDGKAAGVVEAKKTGATLTPVNVRSGGYAQGLPPGLPAWRRPLPVVYESTGVETHFTNGLDPTPRARQVSAFHRPEMLAEWLAQAAADPPGLPATVLTTDGRPPVRGVTGSSTTTSNTRPKSWTAA